jgi:hypothetical protein
VKFDKELIEEFESGGGDLDIICQPENVLTCHSCVIACQSKIMRKSIKRNVDENDHLRCPKFPLSTMRKLITIMYGIDDLACSSACEMVQILVAAAYYTIPWVVQAMQDSVVEFCSKGRNNKKEQATRCRDVLLILQETVSFSIDDPNPGYAPFDSCLQPLTDALIARLQSLALEGTVPEPIDPVAITEIITTHLEKDDKSIQPNDPLMAFMSFYYIDLPQIPPATDIFHGIILRNTVLQQIMVDLIPDVEGRSKKRKYLRPPGTSDSPNGGDDQDDPGSSRPGNRPRVEDPLGHLLHSRQHIRRRHRFGNLGAHDPPGASQSMRLRMRDLWARRRHGELVAEDEDRNEESRNAGDAQLLLEPLRADFHAPSIHAPSIHPPDPLPSFIDRTRSSIAQSAERHRKNITHETSSEKNISTQFGVELEALRRDIRQAIDKIASTSATAMRDRHTVLRERLKDFTKRLKSVRSAAPLLGMHRRRLESLLFPIPDMNLQLAQIVRRLDALELPFHPSNDVNIRDVYSGISRLDPPPASKKSKKAEKILKKVQQEMSKLEEANEKLESIMKRRHTCARHSSQPRRNARGVPFCRGESPIVVSEDVIVETGKQADQSNRAHDPKAANASKEDLGPSPLVNTDVKTEPVDDEANENESSREPRAKRARRASSQKK